MEIKWKVRKLGLLLTVRLENTFSRILNTFLASEFYIQSGGSVIRPFILEDSKTFPKRLLIRKHITSLQSSTFFQTKERTFAHSVLMLP